MLGPCMEVTVSPKMLDRRDDELDAFLDELKVLFTTPAKQKVPLMNTITSPSVE